MRASFFSFPPYWSPVQGRSARDKKESGGIFCYSDFRFQLSAFNFFLCADPNQCERNRAFPSLSEPQGGGVPPWSFSPWSVVVPDFCFQISTFCFVFSLSPLSFSISACQRFSFLSWSFGLLVRSPFTSTLSRVMSRVEDVKTPVKIALSRCHGSSPPRGCVCLFIAPARISTFRFLLSALLLATPIYSYLHQNTEHEVRIVPVSPDFCFQVSAFYFVSWSCHSRLSPISWSMVSGPKSLNRCV